MFILAVIGVLISISGSSGVVLGVSLMSVVCVSIPLCFDEVVCLRVVCISSVLLLVFPSLYPT